MAATHCRATDVTLRLEIPRDAAGDLHAGVRSRLARHDDIEILDIDVVGLQPRLNDLTVEAEASIRLTPDAEIADLTGIVGIHEAQPIETGGPSR
ncbi:hypothetical protein J2751_001577 [Halorubrum alkaliphilum]|uniref:Uncharacterized protein n=1 Tax=Halorubrum alkaliphilum TaxID=261290 RepID=A0A8T4GFQ9_9EURY|nr:hypothetical protein [Halorubrum alkaliphilum]MBP1922567.1 hypothetical protein [Halorubrum alkaliphilum]